MALVNDSGNARSERMSAAVTPRMKNRMTGEARLEARTSRFVAQAPQWWQSGRVGPVRSGRRVGSVRSGRAGQDSR